jgi:hypothetical protein
MIRSILAVLAGVLTWIIVATVGDMLLRMALPGYRAAELSMTFTLSMMVARLGLGVASSLAAGLVCSAIARGRIGPVYACAALVFLSFLPVHYNLWHTFPLWYHLFFLATLAPLIVLGALWHRRSKVAPTLSGLT